MEAGLVKVLSCANCPSFPLRATTSNMYRGWKSGTARKISGYCVPSFFFSLSFSVRDSEFGVFVFLCCILLLLLFFYCLPTCPHVYSTSFVLPRALRFCVRVYYYCYSRGREAGDRRSPWRKGRVGGRQRGLYDTIMSIMTNHVECDMWTFWLWFGLF